MAKTDNQKVNTRDKARRLATLDDMDRMIRIVPNGLWLSMLIGLVAVVIIVIWSIVGKIPVSVKTSGIYTYGEGINTIYAGNGGVVANIYAKNGDIVEVDDLIADFQNEEVQKKIDDINERRAYVEAVTLDSTGDVGTDDNKDMLNLKTQMLSVGNNKNADDQLLADKQAEMAAQVSRTDAAKDAMDEARTEYYASLDPGSTVDEELEMQDAKDTVSNARNNLTIAKNDYEQAKNDISTAKNDVTLAKNDVASAKSDYDRVKNDISTAKSDVANVKTDRSIAQTVLSKDKSETASLKSELSNAESEYNNAKNKLETEQNALKNAQQQYNTFLRDYNFVPTENSDYSGITYDEKENPKGFDKNSNYQKELSSTMLKWSETIDSIEDLHMVMNTMVANADNNENITYMKWIAATDTEEAHAASYTNSEAQRRPNADNPYYDTWINYRTQQKNFINATYDYAAKITQLNEKAKTLAAAVNVAQKKLDEIVDDEKKYTIQQKVESLEKQIYALRPYNGVN